MQNFYRLWLVPLLFFTLFGSNIQAQQADTLKKYENPADKINPKQPFYKTKAFRATIVPTLLIGYGISTIKDHGFYSSYDAREDILRKYPHFDTWLDNPLLLAPYAELVLANLLNQKSSHDFVNTTLLILKAEAIFGVTVFGLKQITHQERPNGEDSQSMPSGHTAQAFLAASILHSELRYRSNWYGVGAYTIATSVGAIRMLKNKHWESDVFVGAGIGILSSHVAYITHRNRWGRKPFAMAPTYLYGVPAVGLSVNFDEFYRKKTPVDLTAQNN